MIRMRDNFTCQRCGKKEDGPSPYIHCAHFYGRSAKSTRFDPENALALCGTIGFPGGCHGYLAQHPMEFVDLMKKRLGQKRLDMLTVRAKTPTKIDERMIHYGLKVEMDKMKFDEKQKIIGAR